MAQREAIIELHRAGKKNSDIIKLIKGPKSTVYNTIRDLKNLAMLQIVLEVEDHELLGLKSSKKPLKPVSQAIQKDP